MMKVLLERESGPVRVRVTSCDCRPGCDTRFVFATTHPALWLGVGAADGQEEAEEAVDELLSFDLLSEVETCEVIERGVAIVGMRWPQLMRAVGVVLAQVTTFAHLPGWMLRVDLPRLWAVRACVVGDDLTRVPRALYALDRYYDAGGTLCEDEVLRR